MPPSRGIACCGLLGICHWWRVHTRCWRRHNAHAQVAGVTIAAVIIVASVASCGIGFNSDSSTNGPAPFSAIVRVRFWRPRCSRSQQVW